MSSLVLADLHLSANPRDAYRHAFMQKLPDLARKLKVSRVIVLGDLTDEKDHHGAWLTNMVADYFSALTETVDVIWLLGNHDYVDIDYPFFAFLRHMQGVRTIFVPTRVRLEGLGECLFLPHTRNYKREWKGIRGIPGGWCFAHNTFDGADVGHGRRLEGIPHSALPQGMRVISGDVHTPQRLGKVIEYVGAPYLVDFGDDYVPRMLVLQGGSKKEILCEGPQKRLVEGEAGKGLTGNTELNPGDIVKVRLTIKQKHVAIWNEIRTEVTEWARRNKLILHAIIPVVEGQKDHALQLSTEPKSDHELVREFASRRSVDKRTLKTGLFLMEGK